MTHTLLKHARLLALLLCLATSSNLRGGSAESRIFWVDGKAHVEVAIDAKPVDGLKEVSLPLELLDAKNASLWKTVVKVPVAERTPWKGRFPLQNIKEPAKPHQVTVSLRDAKLGIEYHEEIHFGAENAAVQSYGLMSRGIFPERKVYFRVGLNGIRGTDLRAVPVTLKLRDGEENVILNKQAAIRPTNEPQLHTLDVTPDTSAALGPFTLEAGLESDALSIFFNVSHRFAQPNAVVPFSSMEHGDPTSWFAAGSGAGGRRNQQAPAPPPPGKMAMYYSPQMMGMEPHDNPRITYDRETRHAGRQSLRVDYEVTGVAHVFSQQPLPGKPLALWLWVKGNGSKDQLIVHFEDNINHGLAAWHRNAEFSTVTIGTLDFADWRRFRVPVLGEGLQVTGLKGSTEKVDAPVSILGFSIQPEAAPKGATKPPRRTIWLDDLAAETQAPAAEMLSLEMQASDPVGRLSAEGSLAVAVGNGYADDLKRGKVTLLARDADDKPILTRSVDLVVPAGGFAATEVPLKELAERQPRGPVEIDVTYQDPGRPATRISRRITFKSARQRGVFFDFEEPASYSGYQPGKVGKSLATIVKGGADGSPHALSLPVQPKQDDNSVLFHPALPGIVDRVEMMVKGGDRPVTLQAWFVDSGNTGIWIRPYNVFWADPVTVDWQGWRKVVVQTPPIPAYHGDKNRYFWNKPWYPLNLAVNATLVDGEAPTQIQLDNIQVITHLPDDEQLVTDVDYPDETRIHPVGAPLQLNVINFAASAAPLQLDYELRNYQGFVARTGKLGVTVPPGVKQKITLIESLPAGIYDLRVSGLGKQPLVACVMVVDAKQFFGPEPLEVLNNGLLLRRQLGLTTEKVYMDWDNFEAAPHLFHFNWFEQEIKKARNIKDLPKELDGLAARFQKATEAVAVADRDAKTVQTQELNAARNEKAAADKVDMTVKLVPPAQAEVDVLTKQFGEVKGKVEAAQKLLDTEKANQMAALKASTTVNGMAKTAAAAVPPAEKAARDAEAAAKDQDAKVKQADEAATKTAKEAADAEAAAKKAEETMKDKPPAKEARTKADAAKKRADAARVVADEARKLAKTKQDDVAKAKAKLEMVRADLTAVQVKVKAAEQALTEANKKVDAATKALAPLKTEMAGVDQKLQAAKRKLADLSKRLDAEKEQLAARVKESKEAASAAEKAKKALDAARAELDAADKVFETGKGKYYHTLLPVVGFAAEWAGPEAVDALEKRVYHRWIPNRIQVPLRMVDWSLFVRNVQREYKGRFGAWVFWENPDLDDSPQSIPPEKYAPMLESFARWVKLYSPQAKVVAGGFNFNKSLNYFQRIPEAHKLPFDEVHVQMNLGELSPERADMEGYLDDLNDLLKVRDTKRTVRLTELDWAIGKFLSPLQQAAYHARAALVLESRGVPPHEFNLINTGFEFDGYGVFYRVSYGNTADLQTFKPCHVPKPAYFALAEVRKFLKDWQYVTSVSLSDKSLAHNRAFIYKNQAGAPGATLTAVVWRAVDGMRTYRLPPSWRGAVARDVFGFPVALEQGLPCTPLPFFVRLPSGYQADQLLHDLRGLEAADGSHAVILDLHVSEPDSVRRAGYRSTGKVQSSVRAGIIPGERKVREPYLDGLEAEEFSFNLEKPGNVLLSRRWYFDGEGNKLIVRLNGGPEQAWDLTKGQGNDLGLRETTLVLRNAKAGANRLEIRYEKPGNCAGYRLEPLAGDQVPLTRWGILNTRQTKGDVVKHTSAVGTPLTFGKTPCDGGIGAHAVSFIEYPLDGQFKRFEVTVGIDGSTEGRGSAVFRVFVDGKERATSGIINGFSKPKTLAIDKLDGAKRLILSVTDAEDGNRDDLANWVDGKLWLTDN